MIIVKLRLRLKLVKLLWGEVWEFYTCEMEITLLFNWRNFIKALIKKSHCVVVIVTNIYDRLFCDMFPIIVPTST